MQEYKIEVLEQAFSSLESIIDYIQQDNVFHAIQFREGILNTIEKLNIFPQSGKNLIEGLKAKVYKGRLIIYFIDEDAKEVVVIDIIDPQQHTEATKYF